MEEIIKVELPEDEAIRADKYISGKGIISRSQFEICKVRIEMDGREIKNSRKLKNGETISVSWELPDEPEYGPEKLDLDILYEDDQVIVLNKPQGMVVHPGNGNYHGTLVQGLLYYNKTLSDSFSGEKVRPGIVHRLDKDTSGLIITAKNTGSLESLSAQFRDRTTEKYYVALVKGRLPVRRGVIDTFICRDEKNRKKFTVHESRGKHALTRYEVLKTWNKYTLVRLKLETGRTHQLRVHLLSMGCPIMGDPIYARKDNRHPDATLMLHSWKLSICLPGEDTPREFLSPLPKRFQEMEERLTLEDQASD